MATRFNGGIIGVRNSTTGSVYGSATGRFSSNEVLLGVKDATWPQWQDTTIGNLFAWGRNFNGLIPRQAQGSRTSPVFIDRTTIWVKPSTAAYTGICTKSDGTLWSWGRNTYGELGRGDAVNRSSPVQIGALTNWSQPSLGGNRFTGTHALCIKTDGTLWAWGDNVVIDNKDARGLNGAARNSSPVQVGSDTNWAQVSSGIDATVAIKTTGTLWSCGYGRIGTGSGSNTFLQTAGTGFANVAHGGRCTTLVKTDGTLWTMGNGPQGQLGNNTAGPANYTPQQIGALTNWSQPIIRSGDANAYSNGCIKTDGTLWMWGKNTYGQLGLGDTVSRSSPVQVGSDSNWSSVALGGYANYKGFCVGRKTNGKLYAWGSSGYGQLGQGNTTDHSSPIQVGLLTNWVLPAAGIRTSFCTTT